MKMGGRDYVLWPQINPHRHILCIQQEAQPKLPCLREGLETTLQTVVSRVCSLYSAALQKIVDGHAHPPSHRHSTQQIAEQLAEAPMWDQTQIPSRLTQNLTKLRAQIHHHRSRAQETRPPGSCCQRNHLGIEVMVGPVPLPTQSRWRSQ